MLLGPRGEKKQDRHASHRDTKKSALPVGQSRRTVRKLCEDALQPQDDRDLSPISLLRQAGKVAKTPADCATVINHVVDVSRDEPFIRIMVAKLISPSSLTRQSKHICLAANALARSEIWVPAFGSLVHQLCAHQHPEISFESLSAVDVAQLCRFTAVFRRHLTGMGLQQKHVLETAHSHLQRLEESGKRMEATGLISLLRSVAQVSDSLGDAQVLKSVALWLRTRLVKELPLCSPRQLASALLDLGALRLLDDNTLVQLQREVTRNWRANTMRARDLVSIISAYAKLEGAHGARQDAIQPLLPQMLQMMSQCSGSSLCELLHGLASANMYDRVVLDEWSHHFAEKAGARFSKTACCNS